MHSVEWTEMNVKMPWTLRKDCHSAILKKKYCFQHFSDTRLRKMCSTGTWKGRKKSVIIGHNCRLPYILYTIPIYILYKKTKRKWTIIIININRKSINYIRPAGYIFSSLNSERTFVSWKVLTAIRNKASGAATDDKERVSIIIVCNCSIATVATVAVREV